MNQIVKGSSFAVGDEVAWTSSSNGTTTTKRGKVAKVVKAKEYPNIHDAAQKLGAVSNYGGGFRRGHDSYLVLVPHPGKGKPRLYWPVASLLRKVA